MMSFREEKYYRAIWDKLSYDEIKKYLLDTVKVYCFKNIFEFKDYCINNKIDLGDFIYSPIYLKNLFEDYPMYILEDTSCDEYSFCVNLAALRYKSFDYMDTDKLTEKVKPFDNEQYKQYLFKKALDILNDLTEDELEDFIRDNS